MKRKYPRSVRGAKRRGWVVLEVEHKKIEEGAPSYLGLQIWTDRNAKGKWVSAFNPTKFAFELDRDASWFALKWL